MYTSTAGRVLQVLSSAPTMYKILCPKDPELPTLPSKELQSARNTNKLGKFAMEIVVFLKNAFFLCFGKSCVLMFWNACFFSVIACWAVGLFFCCLRVFSRTTIRNARPAKLIPLEFFDVLSEFFKIHF